MENQAPKNNEKNASQLNFVEVISNLLKGLETREKDVIKRRYELTDGEKETLEEIGQSYKITRERVRQIEVDGLKKLKQLDFSNEEYLPIRAVEQEINKLLRSHGGIMEEEYLFSELLKVFGDFLLNRRSIAFIMSQIFTDKFYFIPEDDSYHGVWKLSDVSRDFIENILIQIIEILDNAGRPMKASEFLSAYKSKYCTGDVKNDPICYLTEKNLDVDSVLLSYVKISKLVKQNILGEWGLADWNIIIPKRMTDKAYLVFKQEGKPLHYADVTRLINEAKFDRKVAQAPTVHNELIMDDKYVLVGRGMYALKEWGYQTGTVTEIIFSILKENGPLAKDELMKKVLDQRVVRKTTINLSLSDKSKFKRTPTGEFDLA